MTSDLPKLTIALLLTPSLLFAQAAPVSVQNNLKPALKRDHTQRVLYPRIIQCEDERTITQDLVDLLVSHHGGARRRAIRAIGRIGYPSALLALIDVLNAPKNPENRDPESRALAAFALGEVEHHKAAAALLDHIDPATEKSALVRARSAEALGKIASNKFSSIALGKYGVSGIAESLSRLLPPPSAPPSDESKLIASMTLTALLRVR